MKYRSLGNLFAPRPGMGLESNLQLCRPPSDLKTGCEGPLDPQATSDGGGTGTPIQQCMDNLHKETSSMELPSSALFKNSPWKFSQSPKQLDCLMAVVTATSTSSYIYGRMLFCILIIFHQTLGLLV